MKVSSDPVATLCEFGSSPATSRAISTAPMELPPWARGLPSQLPQGARLNKSGCGFNVLIEGETVRNNALFLTSRSVCVRTAPEDWEAKLARALPSLKGRFRGRSTAGRHRREIPMEFLPKVLRVVARLLERLRGASAHPRGVSAPGERTTRKAAVHPRGVKQAHLRPDRRIVTKRACATSQPSGHRRARLVSAVSAPGERTTRKDAVPGVGSTNLERAGETQRASFECASGAEGEANKDLAVLELFAGCGGLSHIAEGADVAGVPLRLRWSVERDTWAAATWRVNHGHTGAQMFEMDVVDFLALLKWWAELRSEHHQSLLRVARPAAQELRVRGATWCDTTGTVTTGCREALVDGVWLSVDGDDRARAAALVLAKQSPQYLPERGGVAIMTAGPPCQGNVARHGFEAAHKRSLTVIVAAFAALLAPRLVLMEHVKQAEHSEELKRTRRDLHHAGYAIRRSTLLAGWYGVPQVRMRLIWWGARIADTALPPLPLPTHQARAEGWMAEDSCDHPPRKQHFSSNVPTALSTFASVVAGEVTNANTT
ncbi:hypothetical protein CYMTET_16605 [Cymbomonas tetramitiformis]|uniref:DNA (cytosine-5-)-methyltransferase n=1 Tax=Cymbomonas tetramitiformis TaxID=36881 RepID=A0AAE0GC26_9CHLO|nr:hypothetical protein CYMTET_16605 [Cymbomonas tetramitiformis]